MKLYSVELEKLAIKSICNGKSVISSNLMSHVNIECFAYPATKEAFTRISKLVRTRGNVPSWEELINDPVINEDHRKILKQFRKNPIGDKVKAINVATKLHEYGKLRGVYQMAKGAGEQLKLEKIDPNVLLETITDQITGIRTNGLKSNIFTHYGINDNSKKLFKKILYSTDDTKYIPTGFKNFDKQNIGLPRGGLTVVAATTSGGKSALAINLAMNMASWGARIGFMSLEMDSEEVGMRQMSYLTGISMGKILRKELSEKEKKYIMKKRRRFEKIGKKKGSGVSIVVPEEDISAEEALFLLKPYAYDVIIIDYISLLKGVDDDKQWMKLGAICRFAKRFASNNNCQVILLAQLSSEGIIRYARSIQEHACVIGNTFVDRPSGLIQIDEMANNVKGTQKLITEVMSEHKSHITSHWHNNGKKDVWTITTDKGHNITATKTHKFKVLTADLDIVWKELKEIKQGDFIAMSRKTIWSKRKVRLNTFVPKTYIPIKGNGKYNYNRVYNIKEEKAQYPKNVTVELAKVIGYLLTDGCVLEDRLITYVSSDYELVKDYVQSFYKVFKVKPIIYKEKLRSKKPYWSVRYRGLGVKEFLQSLGGFGGKSRVKYIPNCIMQSPKEVVSACIASMIDCDGYVTQSTVGINVTSKEMMRRLHILLLKMGIDSEFKTINIGHRKKSYWNKHDRKAMIYQVLVQGNENIKILDKNVKLNCKRKKIKHYISFTKSEKIPYLSRILKEHTYYKKVNLLTQVVNEGGLTTLINKEMGAIRHKVHNKNFLSKLKYTDIELYNKVITVVKSDYIWKRVSSVRYAGKQIVYDITVPETSSFVANGFISHNSNMFTWVYDAEAEESGIIEIQQPKARNQKRFPFNLKVDFDKMLFEDAPDDIERKPKRGKKASDEDNMEQLDD